MFRFLEVFRPLTKYLINHFGMFGVVLSMAIPTILLLLVIAAFGGFWKMFQNRVKYRMKHFLRKANALRKKGDYPGAYALYKLVYRQQKNYQLISAYEIGMFCKEALANDLDNMDESDYSPVYWFSRGLSDKPETHYEYALCLLEKAGKDPISAAKGSEQMRLAGKLGHKEAAQYVVELDREIEEALKRSDTSAAAALGDPQSQYRMYRSTGGADAVQWLMLAADQKHAEASEALGMMYYRGEGVNENVYTAVRYLTVAAEAGLMNAQAYLGLINNSKEYQQGTVDAAIRWYTLAAEQGHAYSMFTLAVLYAKQMEDHAKRCHLTTRLERYEDKTYRSYYEHFEHWSKLAAQHGLTPDKLG